MEKQVITTLTAFYNGWVPQCEELEDFQTRMAERARSAGVNPDDLRFSYRLGMYFIRATVTVADRPETVDADNPGLLASLWLGADTETPEAMAERLGLTG
jgi:hypothetical protein